MRLGVPVWLLVDLSARLVDGRAAGENEQVCRAWCACMNACCREVRRAVKRDIVCGLQPGGVLLALWEPVRAC